MDDAGNIFIVRYQAVSCHRLAATLDRGSPKRPESLSVAWALNVRSGWINGRGGQELLSPSPVRLSRDGPPTSVCCCRRDPSSRSWPGTLGDCAIRSLAPTASSRTIKPPARPPARPGPPSANDPGAAVQSVKANGPPQAHARRGPGGSSGPECRDRRSAALGAVAQQVIGQHAGHHRLAHGHGADTDAGVVTALGHHLDLVAVDVDAAPRG